MVDIPKTQTAAFIENPGPDAQVVLKHNVPVSEPKEGEVLVKMECCGLWYKSPSTTLPSLIQN